MYASFNFFMESVSTKKDYITLIFHYLNSTKYLEITLSRSRITQSNTTHTIEQLKVH